MFIKRSFKAGLLAVFVITLFILANPASASASEGTFELNNLAGNEARCFAYSVLMQNRKYNVLMSCRDIIYPGGDEVFQYVVWGTSIDGNNEIKLGTLGLGKNLYTVQNPFSTLFVTKESDDKVRQPQGQVIMRGVLDRVELLEEPGVVDEDTIEGEPEQTPELTPSPTGESQKKTIPQRLGGVFAAGGVIGLIALIGAILAVFFITRR